MPDVFNRTSDAYGGSFPADHATLTFPAIIGGGADAGLLVQNMSCNYQQQVQRLYELGSPNVYYVAGRTSGGISFSRVAGPAKISREFYATYGDVCNARTNTLHFSMVAGCDTQAPVRASFTSHFVVIVSIGITVAAADMLINEQLQAMFSSFLYN